MAGIPRNADPSRVPLLARPAMLRAGLLLSAVAVLLTLAISSRASADDDSNTGAPTAPPATAPMASTPESDSAVKSGGNALRSDDRFPWYDPDRDDLRPVVLHRFKDDGKTDSDDDESSSPKHHGRMSHNDKLSGNGGSEGGDSQTQDEPPPPDINMPEISAPWLIWVAWIVIGGVLVFLAVMLIRAFLNREARKAKSSDGESIEAEDDSNRLDALPLPAKPRSKGTLLEEARRCYDAGDYNTAIVYLYGHQLLKLDQNQWIRLAKGKTNREYLRELSGRGELQGVLARTMVPFEDVYFGDHSLDRTRFEACWNDVERFDRLVERASA